MAIEELNQLKAAKKKELVQLKEQLRNVRKEVKILRYMVSQYIFPYS